MKFLIDFKQDVVSTDIQSYLLDNQCTVIKQYQNYEEVYLVECATTPPTTAIVEGVVADEANPIKLMSTTSADVGAGMQYGTFSNSAANDWWKVASVMTPDFSVDTETYPIQGKNITVYVMDSGIDLTHPEFEGANIQTIHSFTGEFSDTTGHGTSLASVIAGKTCGMTSANLKVVKVFDQATETLQSDLLNAFDAIITDFTNSGSKASVLNMSWGIDKNDFIESKIAKLISSGVFAVAAAGNSGTEIGNVTPAGMDPVITIGSYSQDFQPSNFSNYSSAVSLTQDATNGGQLDGWAPGENIYAAIPGGTYGLVSGTSIAAAIHTAAIAYNLSNGVTSSGLIAISLIDGNGFLPTFIGEMGFYRRYMMHLDDPKYANSVNLVTTFKTKPSDIIVGAASEFKVDSGQRWGITVGGETAVANIACDNLPAGLTIDNGQVIGQLEITDGSAWKYFEIDLTFTLRDGGESPYQIRVWVLSDTFDENDPTADPKIKVTPYAVNDSCTITTCVPSGCSSCHNCGDAKNVSCYCTGLACN